MADGIKNTPNYEQTKSNMFWSDVSSTGWVFLAGAMALTGLALIPAASFYGALIGVPMLAASIFPAVKAYKSSIDVNAGYAEINAQRTAQLVAEKMATQQPIIIAQQPATSPDQQAVSMEWQRRMAAEKTALATAPCCAGKA